MIADLKPYTEYGDSGLPWLGFVPQHWEVRALRQVGRWMKGRQPKRLYEQSESTQASKPYLSMEYVRQQGGHPKTFCVAEKGLILANQDDVLLLWDGANAGEFLKAKSGVVASTSALFTGKVHNGRYLYYVLKQCESHLRAFSVGMGIPHVDGTVLKQMRITIPPPDEQAAIVRYLDWANGRLERVIRAKRQTAILLNEQKQAIVHRAVTRGLDPLIPFKPSGISWLGDIPQHWQVSRLANLASFISGKAHEQYVAPAGEFTLVTARFISTNGQSKRLCTESSCVAQLDDVLMVMSDLPNGRALARSFLVRDHARYAVNQRVCVLRPHSVNPTFLSYWANRNPHLVKNDDGFNQTHLSNYDFKTMPVALPPEVEQRQIADSLDSRLAAIDRASESLHRECKLLEEFRTRLIADVVTGKFDVRKVAGNLPDETASEFADLVTESDDQTSIADKEVGE
jgi:type I restriction enzyme S subunit